MTPLSLNDQEALTEERAARDASQAFAAYAASERQREADSKARYEHGLALARANDDSYIWGGASFDDMDDAERARECESEERAYFRGLGD